MNKQKTKFKQTEIGNIPEDWEVKTIDEVKSNKKYAITMGPFGSNIKKENFVPFGVPVIRGSNLSVYKFLDEGFVFVTEEKADELKASNAVKGDIIITHRGTLGQVGIIPNNPKYARYIVSQSGMKLTCDSHLVDNEFVFYYLKSKRGQHELLKNKSQTGVPAIAQPSSSLKQIHIPIPELVEQHSIAKILSDLDAKIELNQRMNKTLEAIGQAIFKHWFIDFEFPNEEGKPYKSSGGEMVLNEELEKEIPKGWEVGFLGDNILTKITKTGVDDFSGEKTYLATACIENSSVIDENTKITIEERPSRANMQAKPNTVWFAKMKESKKIIFFDGYSKYGLKQFILSTGFAGLDVKDFALCYIWCFISRDSFETKKDNLCQGTTMQAINNGNIRKIKILIPPKKVLESFNQLVKKSYQKVYENDMQSRNLSKTRDLLLPKLMSGKIRVKEFA